MRLHINHKAMPLMRRAGISVIELLVVVGVIGFLVGLLLPAVQQVRGTAIRLSCVNTLKQIGLASHHFYELHHQLPPSSKVSDNRDPNLLVSWRALILPQVGEDALWHKINKACQDDPNIRRNPPHTGLSTVVKTFVCPADGRLLSPMRDPEGVLVAFSSYAGVAGGRVFDGVLGPKRGIRFTEISDGLSQTLMVGERPPPNTFEAGNWYDNRWPDDAIPVAGFSIPGDTCLGPFEYGPGRPDNRCDLFHFWSLHSGGANFLFCDGAVRTIPYHAAPLMIALATRAGGEVVSLPE